jgi:hypothetical protein
MVAVYAVHKQYISHIVMWTHERFSQLWTMYATTLLDGKMTKTNDIDLDEFYNFVVYDLFIWNHLLSKIYVRISHNLKFKFWIVQTKSDKKLIKTKVVDLDELYNFVVADFSIWNNLLFQNSIWSFSILKFKFLASNPPIYGPSCRIYRAPYDCLRTPRINPVKMRQTLGI